jgi:hypothetical protein
MNSTLCNSVFERCIEDYHQTDDVHAAEKNPYPAATPEWILYRKCYVDTVQWHLEDLIRNPLIDPAEGLALKRKIDEYNQRRTDIVEQIDDYFLEKFKPVTPLPGAGLNTESPAWAIDRLSILALKIYHMKAELNRNDVPEEHRIRCREKLQVLIEQRKDLSTAIDELLQDLATGKKRMKVYRQMKMYNDPSLNPVLYQSQKQD